MDQITVDGYDMTWGTNTLGEKFLSAMDCTHFEGFL